MWQRCWAPMDPGKVQYRESALGLGESRCGGLRGGRCRMLLQHRPKSRKPQYASWYWLWIIMTVYQDSGNRGERHIYRDGDSEYRLTARKSVRDIMTLLGYRLGRDSLLHYFQREGWGDFQLNLRNVELFWGGWSFEIQDSSKRNWNAKLGLDHRGHYLQLDNQSSLLRSKLIYKFLDLEDQPGLLQICPCCSSQG